MAPKNTTTPNMACATTSSTEKRKRTSPEKKIIRDAEPFRTGHDSLGQAARLYVLEEVRPCACVLAQLSLGLSKLQIAPGPPLHERRGERTYQAQREAKKPENIDTDGR